MFLILLILVGLDAVEDVCRCLPVSVASSGIMIDSEVFLVLQWIRTPLKEINAVENLALNVDDVNVGSNGCESDLVRLGYVAYR